MMDFFDIDIPIPLCPWALLDVGKIVYRSKATVKKVLKKFKRR